MWLPSLPFHSCFLTLCPLLSLAPVPAGENSELITELASTDLEVMKDAVKKVIAAITVGKDMNSMFPHVVNCMRTDNVEVKKLVYLYLINYAKSNPDLTIMAVNSFVKDSEHSSPLIRALAIRTMGCIRVEKITEYLAPPLKVREREQKGGRGEEGQDGREGQGERERERQGRRAMHLCLIVCDVLSSKHFPSPSAHPLASPLPSSLPLQKALGDEDPYVRKTAALCVAKLFDISPAIVRSQGFIDNLKELLSDGNPTVVANAVAALSEIQDATGKDVFDITTAVLTKLLAALNECTEWGQVFILDSLARYTPADAREAENIMERVAPRLVHQNPAVVLSAVKIVMMYMELLSNAETVASFCRKLAPPLITLAQSPQPEVQYVALRNISLIVQKRPNLLSHKIKVFFCKYNDPIYVKMEKLDILVKLVNDKNVEQVLLELKEYASEVDVDYVRRAVRTIGRCAIKLDIAAEKCIKVLLQLIQTKVNYVLQEAIIVIKDIFRRYPNRYESIIGMLCQSLETLDEPEAKASMIWIVGEYADRIDNATELLQGFSESFHDEPTAVQLQLLTAAVKLFLKKPKEGEALVQSVLSMATEHSDNPDLRDRGYIYWRLLSTDPNAAKAVVLAERPVIQDDTSSLDAGLLELLIRNLSSLASVYHKPPEAFVRRARVGGLEEDGYDGEDGEVTYGDDEVSGAGGDESSAATGGAAAAGGAAGGAAALASTDDDLLGLGGGGAAAGGAGAAASDDFFFGGGAPAARPAAPAVPDLPVLAEKDGLVIHAALRRNRSSRQTEMQLVIDNKAGSPSSVASVALKLNLNRYGLTFTAPSFTFTPAIAVGSSGYMAVPCDFAPSFVSAAADAATVQCALRDNSSGRVAYFNVPVSYGAFLTEEPAMEKTEFPGMWKALGEDKQAAEVLKECFSVDPAAVQARLASNGIQFVASRAGPDPVFTMHYFTAKGPDGSGSGNGALCLYELTFKQGLPAIKTVAKCAAGAEPWARQALAAIKAALA